VRHGPHQKGDVKLAWLSPSQYPTWHEFSFRPATPEHMHLLLTDEAKGSHGEFGHHYWSDHHPSFTTSSVGFVLLPNIAEDDVPDTMLHENIVVDQYGKVYLRATVDESVVPTWM
jgi:hypothetical protein